MRFYALALFVAYFRRYASNSVLLLQIAQLVVGFGSRVVGYRYTKDAAYHRCAVPII